METLDSGIDSSPLNPSTRSSQPFLSGLARFATAPFRVRTYTNALFLALAFPLGIAYFVFLTTGFAVGLGLSIVWIGLPILALVFLCSWALSGFERQMAIVLLGAPVPPRAPARNPAEPRQLARRAGDFFGNPVTWKGIAYLVLKFPLGIVSFVSLVTLSATSIAFILAPFAWQFGTLDMDVDLVFLWWNDSPLAIWMMLPFGLGLFWLSLNLLNLLAWVFKGLATALLGSEQFRAGVGQTPAATPAASLDAALPA
jgi:hypothetical protein